MDANLLMLILGIAIGIIIGSPRARQWFLAWWRKGKNKEETCSTGKTSKSSAKRASSTKK